MSIPSRCRAILFDGPGKPLRQAELPVAWPKSGEAIVQLELTTLQSDDFDLIKGQSSAKAPLILGHESVGVILALGDPPPRTHSGEALAAGDRVTWSRYVHCGECFYCRSRLPQECEHLQEYGRTTLGEPPRLSGAMAELMHLAPKTSIFKVPKSLPPLAACLAHSAALALAAIDTLPPPVNTALILSKGEVMASIAALLLAKRGAKVQFENAEGDIDSTLRLVMSLTANRGVDAVIDLTGAPQSVELATKACRPGGAIALTNASSRATAISLELVVQRHLRLTGVRDYKPEQLGLALDFLVQNAPKVSGFLSELPKPRPFSQANDAIAEALKTKTPRITFEPDQD